MGKGSSRAFITLSPRKPDKQWKKVVQRFQKNFRAVVKKVESRGLKFMRQNVPVSTGALRDSYRSRSTVDSQLRGVVFIETSSPYAKFIDQGTAPSVGRYVPILDRRLKTGMHPGIRGVKFTAKTERDMQNVANTELRKIIKKTNTSVGRHFPKGKKGSRVK